jgi:hypothetical protein
MSLPVYQSKVNRIVHFPIWRWSKYIYECCNAITYFDYEIFRYGKFTILTPLSLLISCKLSLPIVSLKMPSLPTLAMKFHKNFHMVFREFVEYIHQFLTEAVLHTINFIFCWAMNIQNNEERCLLEC